MFGIKFDHNVLMEQYLFSAEHRVFFFFDITMSGARAYLKDFEFKLRFFLFAFCLLLPFRHTVNSRAVVAVRTCI